MQLAVAQKDAVKITGCIENGLSSSTHLLCLITESTKNSWWVPYEIGFSKKCAKNIASLELKNVRDIPEYLKIHPCYKGTTGIDNYLRSLAPSGIIKYGILEKSINIKKQYYHPLSPYLD